MEWTIKVVKYISPFNLEERNDAQRKREEKQVLGLRLQHRRRHCHPWGVVGVAAHPVSSVVQDLDAVK